MSVRRLRRAGQAVGLDRWDAALIALVAAVSALQWAGQSWKGGEHEFLPVWLAALLTVASTAAAPAARRWTFVALIASAAVSVAIGALGYLPVGMPVVAVVALYFIALHGHRLRTLLIGLLIAVVALLINTILSDDSVFRAVTLGQLAGILCPLALGDAVRARRAYVAELLGRIEQAEYAREEEAQRRVEQERLRIARELHDLVAHTITTVNVQSGVALHLFDDDPAQARASLGAIKETSREALDELRGLLGVLRNGDGARAPLEPPPDLGAVRKLIDEARTSGLDVALQVAGDPPARIPEAVQLAGYRIVQEALTNVLRHAGPVPTSIRLAYTPECVRIECLNAAPAAPVANGASPGIGMIGMAERASALGGWTEAGPTADGGFRVQAELPYRRVA